VWVDGWGGGGGWVPAQKSVVGHSLDSSKMRPALKKNVETRTSFQRVSIRGKMDSQRGKAGDDRLDAYTSEDAKVGAPMVTVQNSAMTGLSDINSVKTCNLFVSCLQAFL